MTCLVCLLILAVIMDFKSYRISNHLIIFGLILGFLFNFFEYGWTSISLWFSGVLLPILILFPLFLIKALGAGDIKLFSVIGCFYGTAYVFKSAVAAFLIAAVMSLIYLLKHRRDFYRLHHLVTYIQTVRPNYLYKRGKVKITEPIGRHSELNSHRDMGTEVNKKPEPYYFGEYDGNQGSIHFSPAILAAVLLQTIFHSY